MNLPDLNTCTVAVIGLGYVGLPLSVEIATPRFCERSGKPLCRRVIGFDINEQRLSDLRLGNDCTNETTAEEIKAAEFLELTSDPLDLFQADIYLVTVPTPIDSAKRPDLIPLEEASAVVGKALMARAANGSKCAPLVIYESTVYPGATEEICVPIIEKESGLHFNQGFYCGYSPERINPGDTEHKLTTIMKVTSGSSKDAANWVDAFYGSFIQAGTYQAASIKVAEAAKVIENTQRDLNIALVNELAMIFRKMNIDTLDVLDAAASKWNFLHFTPGLVGGHCIGVDPYYLTYKAEKLGYHPEVVLSGRRINDSMGRWVAEQLALELAKRRQQIVGANVLVLGLAFKENCPDIRNTKVLDTLSGLVDYGMSFYVVDPWVDPQEACLFHSLEVHAQLPVGKSFDAVLVLVPHLQFTELNQEIWSSLLKPEGVLFDLKGVLPRELNPIRP